MRDVAPDRKKKPYAAARSLAAVALEGAVPPTEPAIPVCSHGVMCLSDTP